MSDITIGAKEIDDTLRKISDTITMQIEPDPQDEIRTEKGSYNLLAELLSDNNDIPFNFVKFHGLDKAAISERKMHTEYI